MKPVPTKSSVQVKVRENEIKSKKSSTHPSVVDNTEENKDNKSEVKSMLPVKKPLHLVGVHLILQQFYAILVKRAKHTMRKWKMYIFLVSNCI